jgi:hypothetical protein
MLIRSLFAAVLTASVSAPACQLAFADDANDQNSATAAPTKSKKQRGPIRRVIRGLGEEAKTSASGLAKDLAFVFSVQDNDPYAEKPPRNRPYVLSTIQCVDGSEAAVVRNPDGTLKIDGGFADGTIITPKGKGVYTVAYPNGAVGKLEKDGEGFKIYRPDDSITTISRTLSGDYSIANNKLGYMGTARSSDRTGLNYDLGNIMSF